MNYLIRLGDRYYFNRRVPLDLKKYDNRLYVRTALKTDSKKEALGLVMQQNDVLESYWKSLIETDQQHSPETWKLANRQNRLSRFLGSSDPLQIAASLPPAVATHTSSRASSSLTLSKGLTKYWDLSKDKLLNKSANQVRKWQNPRKLAMKTFTEVIGDKQLCNITRDDILAYRDWWLARIDDEHMVPGTANKNFIQVKVVIDTLNDHDRLGLDSNHLFKKLLLPEDSEARRFPFTTEFILNTLLKEDSLSGLNDDARWVLHAIAETGAGLSEQVGLLPEDIILDHDIPHIKIVPRHKKALKTRYRKRFIPLVGFALDAFKANPNGFVPYRDRPDSLSSVLSSYLKDHDLLPSDKHTVYSLRHSFQDRLLAVDTPDRIQADLMGHKFHRPKYGDGASLQHKLEWMKRIQLKPLDEGRN